MRSYGSTTMNMLTFFAALGVVLGAFASHASASDNPHATHRSHAAATQNAFAEVNASMMQDMHALTPTGDVDYDFMRGMIPHHQGAVGMARVLLEQGTDRTLRTLAEDIVAAQEAEITQMQAWLGQHGEPNPPSQAEAQDVIAAWQRIDQRMMRDMHVPGTGNIDADFVSGMIPHHVAAVDMAYVLLAYSTHSGLRDMARTVIREQEREIRQLVAWQQRAAPAQDGHAHH